ncbi:Pentalenene oxygenase [Botrimarina colliarenosi]|uniref:Pentalenene oxygenase n=1 Tax=Botrimarina colliarenosi TaxID=2528001 RepID=A0A5C6ABR6_9BACT|nr:cytochrome P450 [Botrimarina colliarenosi]TWT97029.1 Pentalenene oxygenase [Botrimarina colliarenosi]
MAFSRDLMGGLFQLHRDHGPIAALRDQEAGQMVVCLFDPEYNKQVLSRADRFQARFFGIRGPKRSSQRRVTCGLLAMNGEQHKRNRRMVKEPFGPKAIAAYRPTIEQLAREESAQWRDGEAFDFNQAMIRYMLRVTSRLLFGLDEPTLAYELGEQIAEWVTLNHELGIGALVSTPEFHAGYEGLLEFAKGLESNVMRLIRRRQNDPDPNAHDVLSLLVRSHDAEGGLADEELVGQCCVLFAAAHMTTAHSFSWTTFLLAQHPEVMQTLWDQIHAGTADDPHPAGGPSLLERIIKEAMRVLPASAYSVRMNIEREQLGPLDLPPGTPIVFTPLVTHRLESSFDDPQRFTPDRWLTINPSPYAYHPFGAGPRRCIGGPLAMEVLRTSLPIFLRDWRLSVVAGAEVTAEVKSTMLNPRNGVPMIAERHTTTGGCGGFHSSLVTGNVTELVDLPAPTASPRNPR